jgi:primosomal protein N' (replication factor Y)
MDSDTSSRRGTRSAILRSVRAGRVDILVGTQIITKGLDFHNVTLVAVVLADLSLNLPDFRSAERTFQLLTQAAGRAGRGERPGRVLIQTYAPHHYSVRAAREQDYARFIRREMELRRELMYPPFAHMALVRIEGDEAAKVSDEAAQIAGQVSRAANAESMRVLGPAPAPIERIKGRYRWQLLLKARERRELRTALDAVVSYRARQGVRVSIDIDPLSML